MDRHGHPVAACAASLLRLIVLAHAERVRL
jgi:hypothetical protein